MSKQIPELDIIATPTAGQESLIETVVARHDTYATSRMTLAQIFTLGSISGAIKSALDTLSGLISGNTSSINTLSSTKLNIAGGTRTGLTAKRVLVVDSSGNETYLSGTSPQQIGFDGSGNPATITPSVDIHGSTLKTTPVGADEFLISDSEASFVNKKATTFSIAYKTGGDGSDGAAVISTTVSLIRDMQYTTLNVQAGGIINTNGYRIYYTTSCNIDGTVQDIGIAGANGVAGVVGTHGTGGAGGTGAGLYKKTAGSGAAGQDGANAIGGTPATSTYGFTNNAGTAGIGGTGSSGAGNNLGGSGTNTTNIRIPRHGYDTIPYQLMIIQGNSGGGGGGGTLGSSSRGAGGGGGGGTNGGYVGLYGVAIPTGSGTISVAGGNGGAGGNSSLANGNGAGGGGGGGSGGIIDLPYGTTITTVVSGGSGGAKGTAQSGTFEGTAGSNGSTGFVIFH